MTEEEMWQQKQWDAARMEMLWDLCSSDQRKEYMQIIPHKGD